MRSPRVDILSARVRRRALAVVLVACAGCAEPEPAGLRVGERFPQRSLARLEGVGEIALPGNGAQLLVVNVWATWCAPCRREMQSLERVHRHLGHAGVRVVGISVDEDRRLAAEFVRAQQLSFEHAVDTTRAIAAAPLGVTKFPTTFVVDSRGVVRWREEAARDWSDETAVARLRDLAGGAR